MSSKVCLRLFERTLKLKGNVLLGFIFGCFCTYLVLWNGTTRLFQYSVFQNPDVIDQGSTNLSNSTKVGVSEINHGLNSPLKSLEESVKANISMQARLKMIEKLPPETKAVLLRHLQSETYHGVHQLPKSPANRIVNSQPKTLQVPKYTLKEFKDLVKVNSTLRDRVLSQEYLLPNTKDVLRRYLLDEPYTFKFNETLEANLQRNYDINNDVIVFLHIQKTGGMHFNSRISRELQKPFACKNRVIVPKAPGNCLNPKFHMWFYNTAWSGWQCGLHADWTQMHKCIPGLVNKIEQKSRYRRYFYFTQVRDAVERYLSEYHHQTAHNHWQQALLGCETLNNANGIDVKPCFRTRNWIGVTMEQFIACKDNLATQRMTRMLADLTLAGCYKNFTDVNTMKMRAPIWLESAKRNLQSMEFIALMEDEPASDKLFKETYKIGFNNAIHPMVKKPGPGGDTMKISEEHFIRILQLVELDIHLYLFTKDLFYKRLKQLNDH